MSKLPVLKVSITGKSCQTLRTEGCPYCKSKHHSHGGVVEGSNFQGHRISHCLTSKPNPGYYLAFEPELLTASDIKEYGDYTYSIIVEDDSVWVVSDDALQLEAV